MASKFLLSVTKGERGREFVSEKAAAVAKLDELKAAGDPDFRGTTIKTRAIATHGGTQVIREFWAHKPKEAAPGTGHSHTARSRKQVGKVKA